MGYADRKSIYEKIEHNRSSRVLAFITSDRKDMQTIIAQDCVEPFVDLLEQVGVTERISLILHTDGGQTLAAWRLVNLLKMFCDELEVIVPSKALSAGTLMAIGADRIIMTKQAALGPIDPSVNNPLNPRADIGGQSRIVPVSVESVRGYLAAARSELGITDPNGLTSIFTGLTNHIHPLVLGEIFRSRAQIRFLARKLLTVQVQDEDKIDNIIDFLCADSGSHDYTINRREAADLGLRVEKPSDELYQKLRSVHVDYVDELKMREPYSPKSDLVGLAYDQGENYSIVRGLVEGPSGGCYGYLSEGTIAKVQVNTPNGSQEGVRDDRTFEGWRKL